MDNKAIFKLPDFSKQLLQQLWTLRKEGLFCDCTILVGDSSHRAHKVVLAEFGVLLEMVYTGRLPLGKHNASRIVAAADSLQMFDVAVGFKKVLTTLVGQKVPVPQTSGQEETRSTRSESTQCSASPNEDKSASEKMETTAEDKCCHDNKEDEEEGTGRKACDEVLDTSGLFTNVTVIYPNVC
uniref:BTB domain-containing protein n=1 Tax=Poecilia reticulata TaxID=8081 RepID=A0A3P9Q700_POERE